MEPTLERFRLEVASAVKEEIGNKKWFRGVCMDGVNETYPNFKEAVELAIMQTSYWDEPPGSSNGE
jgi:hypothetical protein